MLRDRKASKRYRATAQQQNYSLSSPPGCKNAAMAFYRYRLGSDYTQNG